jgi:hypothetical protein
MLLNYIRIHSTAHKIVGLLVMCVSDPGERSQRSETQEEQRGQARGEDSRVEVVPLVIDVIHPVTEP